MTYIEAAARTPRLGIDDGGTGGMPAIFLHSLAGNSSHWDAQLKHLRTNRRAVAFDLRGHGRSQPPKDGDYSIESQAEDVDAVANGLGIERFVLVGHSFGGTVSIAYAGSHPERVSGLLLADPSGDARMVPEKQMRQFLSAMESESYIKVIEDYYSQLLVGAMSDVREKVLLDLRNTPRQTVVGVFKASLNYDPFPALRSYEGPKLSVITHLNDAPFSLHKIDTSLPYLRVAGTGHWLQMDKPVEFNKTLDDFLASVDANNDAKNNR
ncbi:MAG: alpha/beta hydrolase [Methanotrichaceae archaeon]